MASWKMFLVTFICTLIVFPKLISSSAWVCRPCMSDAECDAEPPRTCMYGEVRDFCNRRICGQGPGDRCGGVFSMKGKCGEGLMCREERCHGCSMLTLECYN